MLNSFSENVFRTRVSIMFLSIVLAAVGFYLLQNTGRITGGNIALPKLIWLAYAILFWFCLPFLFLLDKRITHRWQIVYRIFLINMLVRAVVELFMMYVTHNWSPYYGIAHDVFSILLLVTLVMRYQSSLPRDLLYGYALVLLTMFVVEIGFVIYMVIEVQGNGAAVYFVPGDDRHTGILAITWLVVSMLTVYTVMFTRRWLRGEFIRANR